MIEEAPFHQFLPIYVLLLLWIFIKMVEKNPLISLLLYYKVRWSIWIPVEREIGFMCTITKFCFDNNGKN